MNKKQTNTKIKKTKIQRRKTREGGSGRDEEKEEGEGKINRRGGGREDKSYEDKRR